MKNICNIPFKILSIDVLGNIQSCPKLFGENKYSLGDIKKIKFYDEWKNNKIIKNLRNNLLKGIKKDICIQCHQKNHYNSVYKTYLNNQKISPTILEIRFSNLCNFSCKMCYPNASSNIAKETNKRKYIYKGEPLINNKNFWNEINKIIPFLKIIYIGGGEPLINPTHYLFLKKIINLGKSKNIELIYHSNLSKLPGITGEINKNILLGEKNIFKYWIKFKKISIFGSCDGYKKIYNKIRIGGDWLDFKRNLFILKKIGYLGGISTVIQKDNIYNIPLLIKWGEKNDINIDLKFLSKHHKLSITNLTEKEKRKIINFYKRILNYKIFKKKSIFSKIILKIGTKLYE